MHKGFRVPLARLGLPMLLCCVGVGCGGGDTVRVSGAVTFKGAPLPAGKIYILPDGAKGNTGPAGYADIKDGRYDTATRGSRGAVSGAVIFKIDGYDPAAEKKKDPESGELVGTPFFLGYQIPVDLPKGSSTKDLDIPASATKTLNPPKERPVIIP